MTTSDAETITLREFVFPDDYEAVIDLWGNAGPGIHLRRSDDPDEIAKKLRRDPDLFLVAEVRPAKANSAAEKAGETYKIVGAVMGGFGGRRGMMYHLAVSPEYRRRKIATLLMEALESRLRAKGCIRYYLLVTLDNDEAMRFYEAHGWERMQLYAYGKNLD
jgi:ribosomal protein S18 acetylase RimI-like enzyme